MQSYRLSLRQTVQLMGGDSRGMLCTLRDLSQTVRITNAVPFHADGFILLSELSRAKEVLVNTQRVTIEHQQHTSYYHDYGTTMPDRRNIISVSGDELLRERKALLPKFGSPHLRACGHLDHVYERARDELKDLSMARATDANAFEHHVKALVFELVFFMIFGERPEPVDNTDHIMNAFQAQIVHSLVKVPRFVTRWRYNRAFNATSRRLFERLSDPDARLGDIGAFLAALPPDKRMGYCVTMLDAGHDTTTMATMFSLYFLAREPQRQEQIRQLVRPLCRDPGSMAELVRLPDLVNAVHEALRLLPPLDRIPASVGDTDYNINVYGINTSPQLWPEPLEYRPERFEDPKAKGKLLSFGAGSRRCLGANLGLVNTVVFVAMILAHHRVTLPPRYELKLKKVFAILRPRRPIPFHFERLA